MLCTCGVTWHPSLRMSHPPGTRGSQFWMSGSPPGMGSTLATLCLPSAGKDHPSVQTSWVPQGGLPTIWSWPVGKRHFANLGPLTPVEIRAYCACTSLFIPQSMQHKIPWDSESPQIKVSMATHSLQIPRLSWSYPWPQSNCRRFDLKAPKGDPEDSFVPQIRIWVGDTNRKCHCAASSATLGADPDSSAF